MPENELDTAAGTTLEDMLGEWYPQTSSEPSSESPETSKTREAAGAPPAEPQDETDPDKVADSSLGEKTLETRPQDRALVAADKTDPPTDDLPASQPLTYTVNGESRSWADIDVIPGHGAIIPERALGQLQQRLSERDNLFERSQQQFQQYQALEKLTEWKQAGPNGQEVTLSGPQGIEALKVMAGRALSSIDTITKVFTSNPEAFLTVDPATNKVMWDKTALQHLATRAELAELNAERQIRQQFQSFGVNPQQQAAQQSSPPFDLAANAPTLVTTVVKEVGAQGLTKEDTDFLAGMIPRFVRTATQSDVMNNPMLRIGEPVLDNQFKELVKRQAATNAQATKTTTATTQAERENQARLAAAARGQTVVRPHTRNTPTRTTQNKQRDTSAEAAQYQQALRSGRWPAEIAE